MNKRINIHINPKNMHKNKKSSRHLGRKWYHGTIQSQMNSSKAELREQLAAKQFVDTEMQ